MKISVIIPVFNDNDRLALCLDALSKQTIPQDQFEVIVIDNGSKSPPQEIVESYRFARYAQESVPSSYAARNHGLEVAQCQLIAFTDADCLPQPTWLEAGIAELSAEPRCDIAGGKISIFPKNKKRPTSAELVDIALGLPQQETIEESGKCMTANLFTRREVFDRVGLFDAKLKGNGDHEWSDRVIAAGGLVRYAEQAEILHPARRALGDINIQMRRHAGGRVDGHRDQPYRPLSLHFWRTVWRVLFPRIDRMRKCRTRLRTRGYGFTAWLRTIPILIITQYVHAFAFVKKALGGVSERR